MSPCHGDGWSPDYGRAVSGAGIVTEFFPLTSCSRNQNATTSGIADETGTVTETLGATCTLATVVPGAVLMASRRGTAT